MNPVVHFEIAGGDRKKLSEFYSKVFGWHIQQMDEMDYGMIDTHGGRGFNGGITTARDGHQPGTVIYVQVDDIESYLEKAVSLGAEVVTPVTDIPDVVTYAIFKDPHGNATGLVKGNQGPQVSAGDGVPITWFEIMGNDTSIQSFYAQLFDWKILDNESFPGYGTVGWEQYGLGGGIGSMQNVPAYAMIYPEVADVDTTVEKVRDLGGDVIMPATDMEAAGIRVAALKDPEGIMFGVYRPLGDQS